MSKNLSARDAKLIARAKRAGVPVRYAPLIIREARAAKVPLSWAFALVDQETGFRNVFGGDHGRLQNPYRAPFYHCRVTKHRVKQLRLWVSAGHASNGVGLTQLTSMGLIIAAENMGGAHKPTYQLREGFRYFRDVTNGDYRNKAWHYNGAKVYQGQIAAKASRWHRILAPK